MAAGELELALLDIDFWLRPDVPVWRYSKDELLERRAEITAVQASRREGRDALNRKGETDGSAERE